MLRNREIQTWQTPAGRSGSEIAFGKRVLPNHLPTFCARTVPDPQLIEVGKADSHTHAERITRTLHTGEKLAALRQPLP